MTAAADKAPVAPAAWPAKQFAQIHGLGVNFVRAAIRDGRLRAKRIGRTNYITQEAAASFFGAAPDAVSEMPERLARPDVRERAIENAARVRAERAAAKASINPSEK